MENTVKNINHQRVIDLYVLLYEKGYRVEVIKRKIEAETGYKGPSVDKIISRRQVIEIIQSKNLQPEAKAS